jgi:dolichol-phosphate mannosyltransferase
VNRPATLVVIPAHGRSAVVGSVRRVLAAADVDVLVVLGADDDATTDVVGDLARTHPEVHLLHRSDAGVGTPQQGGLLWGLDRGYEVLVTMEPAHPAERLPALLAALGDADLVLGSRYTASRPPADGERLGPLLSRAGNACLARALGLPVRDVTTGFRAFHREVLLGIGIPALTAPGCSFRIDTGHRAHRAGYVLAEVPVVVTGERGPSATGVREALTTTLARLRARSPRRERIRLPDRSTRVGGLR